MDTRYDIGFDDALRRAVERVAVLAPVAIPVQEAVGLVLAEEAVATVDCPSVTSSARDGYAVLASDLTEASVSRPAQLVIAGTSVAGAGCGHAVTSGEAVRVMTGAPLPKGADAVVPVELTRQQGDVVLCDQQIPAGRHVIARGSDVAAGLAVVRVGAVLTPAMTGLMAAAGLRVASVYRRPRVGIVATGDEIVAPGRPLSPGQLYASNVVTLLAWLRRFHMEGRAVVVFTSHFRSKVDDDPGRRLAEGQAAAAIVSAKARDLPRALVVLGGDLNDVPGSPPLEVLEDLGGLLRVASDLDPADAATYVWRGDPLELDHIFLAPGPSVAYVPGSARVARDASGGYRGSDHAALRADFIVYE